MALDNEDAAMGKATVFSIRRARKADMDAIEEMVALLFPNAKLRNLPYDVFFMAERSGLPIGFCHLRMRDDRCYISGLGVLAHYREHGFGTALMREALSYADAHGARVTCLKVRALNTASKLYLSLGFFEKRMGETLVLVRKRPS
ncbi:MAG: GNAT family N-acetyltransferase [Candidatus Micrarchaeota archaeon]|nr:GNAT family N-acetyltransferase [Candidatus Micrarchaeota archaeon]